MEKIKRALLSVSDKTGIVELAKGLEELGIEILSTGGTAKLLLQNGVSVTSVSNYTGFPEILDGRVKTLHPRIHAGILAKRDKPDHLRQLSLNDCQTIDMVVVNLYPFEQTIAKPCCTFEEAIENIDIGGPTMLRAAAKNFQDVVAIVDPKDYNSILEEMGRDGGMVSLNTRSTLMKKVFAHTAHYDQAITGYLERVDKSR